MLSIIIPILNESGLLPELLKCLDRQEHVRFEVVLCDGGSRDSTTEVVKQAQDKLSFPVRFVRSGAGRGRQMNVGASVAIGDWYLFLHADSTFQDTRALMLAVAAMQRESELNGELSCAGHFPLQFVRHDDSASFGFYFYEAKSRLDLPDCIHGDQGLMVHRQLFEQVGGFSEEHAFLEDSFIVDKISEISRWVLLPSSVYTSARRFESEGLRTRQTLNALILNFRHVGWDVFFTSLPDIYRNHDQSEPLDLLPCWLKIRELLAQSSPSGRWALWLATGAYVRSQAWQLYYAWYCYIQFRRGQRPTINSLDIKEKMSGFERITDNPLGNFATALLVWCWFYITYLVLLKKYYRKS